LRKDSVAVSARFSAAASSASRVSRAASAISSPSGTRSPRRRRELARLLEPSLARDRLDQATVDLDREPPAALERHRQRLAQPLLGESQVVAREAVLGERPEVLRLEVGVRRALEPSERLQRELLGPGTSPW